MNDIIADRSIMTALGRQLTIAVAKQTVGASNLANINTPNYKTREVAPSFDDALSQAMPGGPKLAVTQPGHFTGQPDAGSARQLQDADGLATRRDGNNVELDRELLHMSLASQNFTAAQTALSAKFRLVRYAISESK
jgi:flagellar basal-body rod protein FlgB